MDYNALKLENQLCFPLYACSREIIKKYKQHLDPLGLTYTQYIVMMVLWETDDVTVKNLGDKLYLDSGTLTPLLKKMESQGLITRERCKDDERNVAVKLTDKGLALREEAADVPAKMGSCLKLPMGELMALKDSLNKFLDSVSDK